MRERIRLRRAGSNWNIMRGAGLKASPSIPVHENVYQNRLLEGSVSCVK